MKEKQRKREEIEDVKKDFYAMFALTDAHKRGKALEAVLNRLFACYGILIKEAFTLKGNAAQAIVEQVERTRGIGRPRLSGRNEVVVQAYRPGTNGPAPCQHLQQG